MQAVQTLQMSANKLKYVQFVVVCIVCTGCVDGGDGLGVHVDADDLVPAGRELRGKW